MRAKGMALRAAILTAALTVCAWSAGAAERIGNCEVSGPKAAFHRPGRTRATDGAGPPARAGLVERRHAGPDHRRLRVLPRRQHRASARARRVEVVNVAWPGTAAGASFWQAMLGGQDRPFDLALAEISITPERAREVDFSVPYYRSDIGLMAKAGARARPAGSPGCAWASRRARPAPPSPGAARLQTPPREFGDAPSMFLALQTGRSISP